jgi:hypothetical protein
MAYYSGGMSAAPMGAGGGGYGAFSAAPVPMMSPGGGYGGGFVGGSPIPMQMQPIGGSALPMTMQPVGGSALPMTMQPVGGSALPMTMSQPFPGPMSFGNTFPGPMSVGPAMVQSPAMFQSPGVVQFVGAPQSPVFGVPVGIGKTIIAVGRDSTEEEIQQSILRSLPPGSVYVGKEGSLPAPPLAAPNSSMPPPAGPPPGFAAPPPGFAAPPPGFAAPPPGFAAPPPPAVDRGFPPAPAPGRQYVVTLNRAVGQFVGPDGE